MRPLVSVTCLQCFRSKYDHIHVIQHEERICPYDDKLIWRAMATTGSSPRHLRSSYARFAVALFVYIPSAPC